MIMIMFIFIILFFGLWVLCCNTETYSQRVNILMSIPNDIIYKFSFVSYEKHLWYLITFRNAIKLYPIEVQEHYNKIFKYDY